MNWNEIAHQARSVDLDRVSRAAQSALRDRATREAVAKTYAHGRTMYSQLTGDGTRAGLGRLARDQKVQGEVGALVRSVTAAVDAGVAKAKRRSKRRFLGVLALLGIGIAMAPKLRDRLRPPAPEPTDGAIRVSQNGADQADALQPQAHA